MISTRDVEVAMPMEARKGRSALSSRWGAIAAGLLALGCERPPDILPVTPPGVGLQKLPPMTDEEKAQALGEMANRNPAGAQAATTSTAVSPPTPVNEPATTASGLTYVTLKEGTGAEAKPGQNVQVHYTGTLTDGKKFDSSRDRGSPFRFTIGQGQVIRGWDEGVAGMKVGERRQLTVPAELGYGANGSPPDIPPNATLIFDIELLGVG